MKQGKVCWLIAVSLLVVVCFGLWQSPVAPVTSQVIATTTVARPADPTRSERTHDRLLTATAFFNLPQSLRDTDIDGELRVDAEGNLVVDRRVRDLFDYFLTTTGEESLPQIRRRLLALILQLPEPAATQGNRLLENYLAFLHALESVPAPTKAPTEAPTDPTLDVELLRERKQAERTLRSHYLEPKASEAFFGQEDAYDDYALAHIEIMQSPNLDAAGKALQLEQLLSQQPDDVQTQIQLTQQQRLAMQLAKPAPGGPVNANAWQQKREQALEADVAARLQQLDQQRSQWSARFDDYLLQRSTLAANLQLDTADRQIAIEALRDQLFSAIERPRVVALEHLNAL